MTKVVLIGMAAGAASALLLVAVILGPALVKPFFYVATPLPILIAAIGWSHLAGLVAALLASAALGLIGGSSFFLVFLVGVGLPAWWLGYLALLARPAAANGSAVTLEWYPIGRLLLWAAVLSGAIVSLWTLLIATDAETLRKALRDFFELMFKDQPRVPRVLVDQPHLWFPQAGAIAITILTVASVWLAARVVRISERLRRPWPDLSAITFPPMAAAMLAATLAGSFLLSDMASLVSSILAAAILTAFGLLGLAIVHALTRGVNGRGLLLGAIYCAIFVFSWPILLLALLGLADAVLDLRGRAARRGPPPPTLQ